MGLIDRRNLIRRVLTAVIAGGAAVYLIVFSFYGLFFVTLVIVFFSIAEYLLVTGAKLSEFSSLLVFLTAFVALALRLPEVENSKFLMQIFVSMLVLGVPILMTYQLIAHNGIGFDNAMRLWFGVIWLVPAGFFWLHLSIQNGLYEFRVPLGMLLLIWMADTGAFFVGKFWGKHKISEKISPNKTWEGVVGGVICNLLLAFFLEYFWAQPFSWYWIGVLTVPVGLMGDLVESMFKRSRNIKDSSGLLPGHGGFLDRFDGFFFVIPFNWVLIQLQTMLL